MELLLEIIFEFLFEGIIEIVKDKRISKLIRYPLFIVITLVYIFISMLFFSLAFSFIRENLVAFIILFGIGIGLLIMFFFFIRKLCTSEE